MAVAHVAVFLVAFIVAGAGVAQITVFIFADFVHSAKLVFVFTLGVLGTLCANVQIVQTFVGLAHVVIIVALGSVIKLRMASVIFQTAVLSRLIAVVIGDFFPTIHCHRLVCEAIVASVCLVDEL